MCSSNLTSVFFRHKPSLQFQAFFANKWKSYHWMLAEEWHIISRSGQLSIQCNLSLSLLLCLLVEWRGFSGTRKGWHVNDCVGQRCVTDFHGTVKWGKITFAGIMLWGMRNTCYRSQPTLTVQRYHEGEHAHQSQVARDSVPAAPLPAVWPHTYYSTSQSFDFICRMGI